MLTEKLEIKVFTSHLKIWYNHAFLPLSRKWKARLSALRPCILNPSWKCIKKSHQDWESTKRVESVVIKRRISIVHCENERGVPWPITLCKLETGSAWLLSRSTSLPTSSHAISLSANIQWRTRSKKKNSKAGIYFTKLF